jgi:hypothetical protein
MLLVVSEKALTEFLKSRILIKRKPDYIKQTEINLQHA